MAKPKSAPTVIALTKMFGHVETRQELLDLHHDLVLLGHRSESLGRRIGENKLVQLSRILSAVTTAAMHDQEPRALTGIDAAATRYLERNPRGAPEVRHRPQTRQDVARRLRDDLQAKKRAGTPRGEVASWLAIEMGHALMRPEPADEVAQKILHGMPSKNVKTAKAKAAGEPFSEDVELTIVAAFKACGMRRADADQLFKARR